MAGQHHQHFVDGLEDKLAASAEYSASKSGLIGLTRSVAMEVRLTA